MKLLQRPLNRYNSLNQGKKDILVLLTVAVSLIIMAQFLTLHRMSDFLVYCMLVLGLDFLYGYMGQLTFGIMLYFGTGTYAATIFWARVSPNPLLGIAVGVAAGVLVALVVGALTIRLRGPIFALANMGFNQVGFFIAAYPFLT
jgi:branched-chain amino acid transport system permease protein